MSYVLLNLLLLHAKNKGIDQPNHPPMSPKETSSDVLKQAFTGL